MESKWNFWNVKVSDHKAIIDLEDPISRIAATWLHSQIKNLFDPQMWFKDRERGLLSWDIMAIEHLCKTQKARLEGLTDADYRVQQTILTFIKSCLSDLEIKQPTS